MKILEWVLGFWAGWFLADLLRLATNKPLMYSKWVSILGLCVCIVVCGIMKYFN